MTIEPIGVATVMRTLDEAAAPPLVSTCRSQTRKRRPVVTAVRPMCSGFVSANRLYDVESQTPIAHPAHQATDEEVQRALKNRAVRADGGTDRSSGGAIQLSVSSSADSLPSVMFDRRVNSVPPQEPQPSRLPIGLRPLFSKSTAAYTAPHSSQAAKTRDSSSLFPISWRSEFIRKEYILSTRGVTGLLVTTVTTEE